MTAESDKPATAKVGGLGLSIEAAADRAWPSSDTLGIGKWLLRWSPTRQNRPRSAVPWPEVSPYSIHERIEVVEDFYERHNDVARFQILPGQTDRSVSSLLVKRNYVCSDSSLVMFASLPLKGLKVEPGFKFRCNLDSDAHGWIQRWATLTNGASASVEDLGILHFLDCPAAFLSAYVDDELVGLGRAAVSQGLLGMFNIFTAPRMRKVGVGQEMVEALANWGSVHHHARNAYLQVESHNEAGRGLYRSAGFTEAYAYHYLILPEAFREDQARGTL